MSSVCDRCQGRGYTTRQEPKPLGRCSSGETVYASHTVPINRSCDACAGRGTLADEAPPTAAPDPDTVPIHIGGYEVDAPGFTQDQYERAIARALIDRLEIYDATDCHVVCHRGATSGYRVTRTSCDCPAGEVGMPCKHRAALIFHLDIRTPARRHQWNAPGEAVAS